MQDATRNLSGIHAESTHPLSMLDPIPRKFHAEFHAECYTESKRSPIKVQAESIQSLPMPNPCLIPFSKQISRKFHAALT